MLEDSGHENHKGDQTDEVAKITPKMWFESMTFSGGERIEFAEDDIVVFVGPNNAGKSAALREMQQFVSRSAVQTVIRDASLQQVGTQADFLSYLDAHSQKVGAAHEYRFVGIGYDIHHSNIHYFDQRHDHHPIAGYFCTRLSTEARLEASNPANSLDLFTDPPTHPIHILLMDPSLESKVSDLFRQAFGTGLIAHKTGGGKVPLLVGTSPVVPSGDGVFDRNYIDELKNSSVPLAQQGDGMRSFVSVLLYVVAAGGHSIQILDEPEAFLHPPQARLLGEFIARERQSKSQLFIATHSTDILDGLIAGGADKIRIIRIQREGNSNHVKELSRSKIVRIVGDTLVRYSGVLEGIFYQHVVICESDADCLFYSSVLHTRSVSGDRRPDVHFIHAAGKHRMAQLAETLRDLNVPTSVIADIDILAEESTFRTLFEKLGGSWSDLHNHYSAIKQVVEEMRPLRDASEVSRLIQEKLAGIAGEGEFPKAVESEIKQIFKSISPWGSLKRSGRAGLPRGQATMHFDKLAKICSEHGLWIVPVGELEGFCKSIEGGHGPSFAAKVLEERDLEADGELQEARDFVSRIWSVAKP